MKTDELVEDLEGVLRQAYRAGWGEGSLACDPTPDMRNEREDQFVASCNSAHILARLRTPDSAPDGVDPSQDEDLAHAVALEVLCRVFEDGADEGIEEWREWYDPSKWMWWARGLGAFIHQRLERLAPDGVVGRAVRLFEDGYLHERDGKGEIPPGDYILASPLDSEGEGDPIECTSRFRYDGKVLECTRGHGHKGRHCRDRHPVPNGWTEIYWTDKEAEDPAPDSEEEGRTQSGVAEACLRAGMTVAEAVKAAQGDPAAPKYLSAEAEIRLAQCTKGQGRVVYLPDLLGAMWEIRSLRDRLRAPDSEERTETRRREPWCVYCKCLKSEAPTLCPKQPTTDATHKWIAPSEDGSEGECGIWRNAKGEETEGPECEAKGCKRRDTEPHQRLVSVLGSPDVQVDAFCPEHRPTSPAPPAEDEWEDPFLEDLPENRAAPPAGERFNINWKVRVRLTERGRKILRGNPAFYRQNVKEDDQGWSDWQLHDLMYTFGQHCFMGPVPPFETEIVLLPERAPTTKEGEGGEDG